MWPRQTYLTILADPPWEQPLSGKRHSRHSAPHRLPYPTMTVDEIKALDVVFPCGRGLSLDNKRLLAPGPRRDGRMLAL